MEKKYLDEIGLQDVASHVNTRLKTVTTMPISASNGAVRLYIGDTNVNYIQGHTYQYNLESSTWIDITPLTDVTNKADKVASATNGDLAKLDSNGNLVDSGILASNVIQKSNTNGLIKNNGTIDTNVYLTATDITDKADKVDSATNGDIAGLDGNGNLTDSGILANNVVQKSLTSGLLKNDGTVDTNTYLTASDISDKADKVISAINGDFAGLDSNGNLTDSGKKPSDFIEKSLTEGLVKNDGTIDTNSYLTSSDIADKADKVASATNGDLAGLDSNGNLTDSGILANNVIIKSNTAGLVKNDGTIDTNTYPNTFTGTQAQWNTLTTAQKKVYDICNITDDIGTEMFYTKSESDATFATKVLSEPIEGATTVEGALGALSNANQATRQLIDDTVGWLGNNLATDFNAWNIGSDGVISADDTYKTAVISGNAGDKFTIKQGDTTGTVVVAYFTSQPAIGNVSYNGSRDIYNNNNVEITMPVNGYAVVRFNTSISNPIISHITVEETLRDAEVIEGKNLIEPLMATASVQGVTCTNNNNGSFTFATQSGGATGTAAFRIDQSTQSGSDNLKSYKKGTYVVSGLNDNNIQFNIMQISTWTAYSRYGDGVLDIPSDIDNCFILLRIYNGSSVNRTIYPQFEIGNTPTPFQPFYVPLKDIVPTKVDNSVIAPVENGTTVQKSGGYTAGKHFIHDGGFCTAKTNIAQGETLVEGTNYEKGDIGSSYLNKNVYFTNIASIYDFVPNVNDHALIFVNANTISTLTNGEVSSAGKITITRVNSTRFDWYGMLGANVFAMGQVNNSAYSSHRIIYQDTETKTATANINDITVDSTRNVCIKSGNVVSCRVRFTLANTISTDTQILKDLPLAFDYGTYSVQNLPIINKDTFELVTYAFVNGSGKVQVSALNAGSYELTGTYICQ